jgi:hypothetical protein
MKIVARIEKLGGDQYLFEGELFDSFLRARRKMVERIRLRRKEQQTRGARTSPLQAAGLWVMEAGQF